MKTKIFWIVLLTAFMSACSQNPPPSEADTNTKSSEPVKEVGKLPTERLQAGAKTINNASKLGEQLQQRADEPKDEADKQTEQ